MVHPKLYQNTWFISHGFLTCQCVCLYAYPLRQSACLLVRGRECVSAIQLTYASKSPQARVAATSLTATLMPATLCLCREYHFWIRRLASNRGYLILNQPRLSEQNPGRFKWQQLHHQLHSTPAGTSLLVADPVQLIQLLADSKSHQSVQHRRQGEC